MTETLPPPNGPQITISVTGAVPGQETVDERELVRRISACVNACEGISTDELEQGIVQDMQRVIAQVAPLLAEKKDDLEQRIQAYALGEQA